MVRLTKAQLAAGNIVALPTAAPRQIDNYRFADQRRAAGAASKTSRFTGRYQHHHQRAADRLAKELAQIRQTPELLILSAIVRTMSADAVTRVLEQLAPGAVTGSAPHAQAMATVKASRLNVGQHMDLMRAFDRLHGEVRP